MEAFGAGQGGHSRAYRNWASNWWDMSPSEKKVTVTVTVTTTIIISKMELNHTCMRHRPEDARECATLQPPRPGSRDLSGDIRDRGLMLSCPMPSHRPSVVPNIVRCGPGSLIDFFSHFALSCKFPSGRGFNWAPVGPSWNGPLGEERTCMSRCAWQGMAWVRKALGTMCICECMNKSSSFFPPSFPSIFTVNFTMP